jgi:uncharacterized protein (DUF1330 family)
VTAYFVAIRKQITDQASMETYLGLVGEASKGRAITPLAAYGRTRTVEGDDVDGAVVLSFPTFEAAEAWYHSDAYQAVLPFRLKGGDYQTFIIQGID